MLQRFDLLSKVISTERDGITVKELYRRAVKEKLAAP